MRNTCWIRFVNVWTIRLILIEDLLDVFWKLVKIMRTPLGNLWGSVGDLLGFLLVICSKRRVHVCICLRPFGNLVDR